MEITLKTNGGSIKLSAPIYKEPEEVLAIPEEALTITGACNYKFASGGWDWFIEVCGDKIITKEISDANMMFSSSKITNLPFEINFKDGGVGCSGMFFGATNVESIPSIDKNTFPFIIVGNKVCFLLLFSFLFEKPHHVSKKLIISTIF